MNFYVEEYGYGVKEISYPCLLIVTDSWDDYGYRTLFRLYHKPSAGYREEIGVFKILDNKTRFTSLHNSFVRLPDNQCSLGQSMDYYLKIKKLFPSDYLDILDKLNDVCFNKGIRDDFEHLEGFKVSLLRSSEAEKVLNEAHDVLLFDKDIGAKFIFNYSVKLALADDKHSINFNFSNNLSSDFRSYVIIGKNGTGKTQYLARLAASLCDIKASGDFSPSRPLFSKIITISFSLFDNFYIPTKSRQFSYKYIGFRDTNAIIYDDNLSERLEKSFHEISQQNRENKWYDIVNEIIPLEQFGIEDSFGNISYEQFKVVINKRSELLSSGQSILIFVMTELIANIRRDSLILFDEPETHLHPNAIAKLIKSFNKVLITYNSYAIIATHSPIIVQETPSIYVKVFDREGNTPIMKSLPEESFGENLSKITDTIFYRNQVKEVYKETFDDLIKQYSIEEINEKFNNKLNFNALLYLTAISENKS